MEARLAPCALRSGSLRVRELARAPPTPPPRRGRQAPPDGRGAPGATGSSALCGAAGAHCSPAVAAAASPSPGVGAAGSLCASASSVVRRLPFHGALLVQAVPLARSAPSVTADRPTGSGAPGSGVEHGGAPGYVGRMRRGRVGVPGAAAVEVDAGEAAARAGVHVKTLVRWCRAGWMIARLYPRRGHGARWLVTLDRSGRPALTA